MWKFVTIASIARKRKPGEMKSPVAPSVSPVMAWDSSARTLLVPTAITRPPVRRASASAWIVAGAIVYHSASIVCASTCGARSGVNVPGPICRVTKAVRTPAAASLARSSRVKCSPAVGAATAPGCAA